MQAVSGDPGRRSDVRVLKRSFVLSFVRCFVVSIVDSFFVPTQDLAKERTNKKLINEETKERKNE